MQLKFKFVLQSDDISLRKVQNYKSWTNHGASSMRNYEAILVAVQESTAGTEAGKREGEKSHEDATAAHAGLSQVH